MRVVFALVLGLMIVAPARTLDAESSEPAGCSELPAEFSKEIAAAAPRTFLALFWASWSAPDRILIKATQEEVAVDPKRWVLRLVDVDSEVGPTQSCAIRAIPQLVAFRDGEAVARLVGARPRGQVREFLEALP